MGVALGEDSGCFVDEVVVEEHLLEQGAVLPLLQQVENDHENCFWVVLQIAFEHLQELLSLRNVQFLELAQF